jgi:glycosyltransferase involved in cell wall biosynthesis
MIQQKSPVKTLKKQNKKVKLLFLCQVFYPEQQSTSQLFTNLFEHLSGENFEVSVICGYPSRPAGEAKIASSEVKGGIRIRRVGVNVDFKKNLFLRACHYLFYLLGVLRALPSFKHYDHVVVATNPPFLPAAIGFFRRFFNFRYMPFLLDLYPEGLIELGKWNETGLASSMWSAMNRHAYRNAEKIIVLGRDMQTLVKDRYGLTDDKFEYFPHWSSFEATQPAKAEQTALWKENKLAESFVIQYSGNMGLWHDIETLVRAAKRLEKIPGIVFLFIGDGMRKKGALKLAEELGVKNIVWLPFQPLETLGDSLACCHLALISQRKGLEGVAVPCKLYGILASGRGVLGLVPKDSEVGLAVTESGCGMVFDPDDDEGLVQAIENLAGQRNQVEKMGRLAFDEHEKKYTIKSAIITAKRIWNIDQ